MRTLFIFILFVIINFSCKKNNNTDIDCNDNAVPQGSYVYPIKPGTAAWLTLDSTSDKLRACQIPDSILAKMSTDAVIQGWLEFPLNFEITAAYHLQSGTQFWLTNFSGLIELQKRQDASSKLFEKYKTKNPFCINNYITDTAKGNYNFSIIYIEVLLAQDTFINKLTIDYKKAVLTEALKKYKAKKNIADYGQLSLATSLFICAKIMKNTNYQPFINFFNTSIILKQYYDFGDFPYGISDRNSDIQSLIKLSYNFIN